MQCFSFCISNYISGTVRKIKVPNGLSRAILLAAQLNPFLISFRNCVYHIVVNYYQKVAGRRWLKA